MAKRCKVAGCRNDTSKGGFGFCSSHYGKAKRRGLLPTRITYTTLQRFCDKVILTPTCWLWRGAQGARKYGVFWFDGRYVTAHRAAWQFFMEDIPEGLHVLHRCDRPGCVNPEHLWLGTHQENHADKVQKRRHRFGSNHHLARLTEDQVRDIRQRVAGGEVQRHLATEYGVCPATICLIVKRQTWKVA